MPRSYRESDAREGDRIVYFDYAKALENRRRPVPWRRVLGVFLRAAAALAGMVAIRSAITGTLDEHVFLCVPFAAVVALGLIPLVRSNRMLSADNIVEARRRWR